MESIPCKNQKLQTHKTVSLVLYGCDLSLKKNILRVKMFDNKVQRKIFGPYKKAETND